MSDATIIAAWCYALAMHDAWAESCWDVGFENGVAWNWPSGYCVEASVALRDELNEAGIAAEYAWGTFDGFGHAWVVVDGAILDVTAGQFRRVVEQLDLPLTEQLALVLPDDPLAALYCEQDVRLGPGVYDHYTARIRPGDRRDLSTWEVRVGGG